MKRKMAAGSTSVMLPIFALSQSAGDGTGLGSIVYNTSGLVGEYRRKGQSSWTTITLQAGTLGTYSAGGWVADGSLTGAYEVGIPDAAFAAGVDWVMIRYRGAANMLPVQIEIELDAVNYQDAAAFGLSRLDVAIGSRSTYAGADTTGVVTLLSRLTATRAGYLDNLATGFELNMSQTIGTVRPIDSVADDQLTIADGLFAAIALLGRDSIVNTTWVTQTPAGSTVRTRTLDKVTDPTSST